MKLRGWGDGASKQDTAESTFRLRIDAIAVQEHEVAQGRHSERMNPDNVEPLIEGPVSAIA